MIHSISVCIPTYKRPELLGKSIAALQNQQTDGFSYSIVIVDNDAEESARELVDGWRRRSPFEIIYAVEPVQNISLARNRAIAGSRGDLIAFMDDDEFPEPEWLLQLYKTLLCFSADGVLGPVLPFFENSPPKWLVKSGLCDRSSFGTGTVLDNPRYMRTGNVMLQRRILEGDGQPFDPGRGRTGGEDAAFFEKMLGRGRSFVWCDEARLFEAVPQERQRRSYHLQRALIRGVTEAEGKPILSAGTFKSLGAVFLYSISLPVLALLGQHLFMKYLVKDCDHLAKLLAHVGIRLVRERTF